MGGRTADAVPNADMLPRLPAGSSPVTVYGGMLALQVRRMPEAAKKTLPAVYAGKEFVGAAVISYPYAMTYGVVAMHAKMPKGKGLWPAFWLLPADLADGEIDVVEVLCKEPTVAYQTVHARDIKGGRTGTFQRGPDLSAAYHEYAAEIKPDFIDFYFDRLLVSSIPTPPSLRGRPFYLLINVSMGTKDTWPGPPDPKQTYWDPMLVTYVKAWQR